MNMKKSTLALIIVLVLLVFIPTAFACSKEQAEINLTDEGFEYSYVKLFQQCVLYWPAYEGVYSYEIKIYATGDLTKCLAQDTIYQYETTIKNSYTIKDSVCALQYLDIYLQAFNEDKSVASNVLKQTIFCSVEDEDIYMAEEQEAGVIPGYEESVDYYYVKLANNINIVKPADIKQYAIVVDDISEITSIKLPIEYSGAYELNNDLNAIVIDYNLINTFKVGATFPMFVTYKNGEEKQYNISIVNVLTPQLDPVIINRGANAAVTISCLSESSKWDIDYVLLDNKICTLHDNLEKGISFSVKNLKLISNGDHNLKIYYRLKTSTVDELLGYSETTLTINAGGKEPYNVNLSYDDTYPAVKVSWNADHQYKYAYVLINSAELSTKNQPELFVGNSITLTNYITKKTDNVSVRLEYEEGEIYTSSPVNLDYNLSQFAGCESYFNTKTQYLDKTVNNFITSQEELDDFIAYHIIHYGDSDNFRTTQASAETYSICSPYLASKYDNKTLANAIQHSLDIFIEPLRSTISNISISGDQITFTLHLKTGSARPYNSYHVYSGYDTTATYQEYPYSELHYYTNGESQRSSTFDDFKYKQYETTVPVSTSLELALALEKGFNVAPAANSNAELILNKAKAVLREIIDDRMTDYEKVLAIYDWMTYNVIYDRGMVEYSDAIKKEESAYCAVFKNSSFYAEGVFLYNIAVCNGIGSAFSILANIEGIPAYKTMGEVNSGSHTWIKVFVNNEWYVCDPTWGGAKDEDNSQLYEFITYDFFMLSQDEAYSYEGRKEFLEKYHKDAYDVYAGNTQFDYFASSTFEYNGKVYTKYISNTQEFAALIDYYTSTLSPGETIQISVKSPEIDSAFLCSAGILYKWLTDIYYPQHASIQANYNIKIYARTGGDLKEMGSSDIGTVIENFNNVAYIRIQAL